MFEEIVCFDADSKLRMWSIEQWAARCQNKKYTQKVTLNHINAETQLGLNKVLFGQGVALIEFKNTCICLKFAVIYWWKVKCFILALEQSLLENPQKAGLFFGWVVVKAVCFCATSRKAKFLNNKKTTLLFNTAKPVFVCTCVCVCVCVSLNDCTGSLPRRENSIFPFIQLNLFIIIFFVVFVFLVHVIWF